MKYSSEYDFTNFSSVGEPVKENEDKLDEHKPNSNAYVYNECLLI